MCWHRQHCSVLIHGYLGEARSFSSADWCIGTAKMPLQDGNVGKGRHRPAALFWEANFECEHSAQVSRRDQCRPLDSLVSRQRHCLFSELLTILFDHSKVFLGYQLHMKPTFISSLRQVYAITDLDPGHQTFNLLLTRLSNHQSTAIYDYDIISKHCYHSTVFECKYFNLRK